MASDLEFTNVDIASFPTETQKLYAELKATWALSKAAKQAFEASARAALPTVEGCKAVFGHRFGKLGIAYAPVEDKPASKAKPVMTLAQFNALADQAGLRR